MLAQQGCCVLWQAAEKPRFQSRCEDDSVIRLNGGGLLLPCPPQHGRTGQQPEQETIPSFNDVCEAVTDR